MTVSALNSNTVNSHSLTNYVSKSENNKINIFSQKIIFLQDEISKLTIELLKTNHSLSRSNKTTIKYANALNKVLIKIDLNTEMKRRILEGNNGSEKVNVLLVVEGRLEKLKFKYYEGLKFKADHEHLYNTMLSKKDEINGKIAELTESLKKTSEFFNEPNALNMKALFKNNRLKKYTARLEKLEEKRAGYEKLIKEYQGKLETYGLLRNRIKEKEKNEPECGELVQLREDAGSQYGFLIGLKNKIDRMQDRQDRIKRRIAYIEERILDAEKNKLGSLHKMHYCVKNRLENEEINKLLKDDAAVRYFWEDEMIKDLLKDDITAEYLAEMLERCIEEQKVYVAGLEAGKEFPVSHHLNVVEKII